MINLRIYYIISRINYIKIFRCLYRRCLPLPIPNRAVKPARADGTAVTGGRVGRCLILYRAPSVILKGLFVFVAFFIVNNYRYFGEKLAMSITTSYLIEIERETENTRRILAGIPNDKLSWKPHAKSMSLGQLASHIVELHAWVSKALSKDVFDLNVDYVPFKASSVEELLAELNEGLETNKHFLEHVNEDDWFQEWLFKAGDYEIARLPRTGAIRFIVHNHLIHHRGQLSVYLRLLDVPVPGLYGPSADDRA